MKDSCPRVWFHPSRSIRRGRDRLIDRPSQGEEQEEEEEEEEEEENGLKMEIHEGPGVHPSDED